MMKTRIILFLILLLLGCCTSAAAGEGKWYKVATGDTLWAISTGHGTTVTAIMEANELDSDLILPGQMLSIPADTGAASAWDDLWLMAHIINAEARGEDFLGKVAVGAVIVNRLRHPAFPKTTHGVIFQCTNGVFEFTPVADGSINLEPDDQAFQAARAALDGVDPTNGALFFYNPETAEDRWIRTLPITASIGNHVFATNSFTST
ncbi:MAG: cell wall hydrolase [Bacillota bacterium]